jgi:hypothetical protein
MTQLAIKYLTNSTNNYQCIIQPETLKRVERWQINKGNIVSEQL